MSPEELLQFREEFLALKQNIDKYNQSLAITASDNIQFKKEFKKIMENHEGIKRNVRELVDNVQKLDQKESSGEGVVGAIDTEAVKVLINDFIKSEELLKILENYENNRREEERKIINSINGSGGKKSKKSYFRFSLIMLVVFILGSIYFALNYKTLINGDKNVIKVTIKADAQAFSVVKGTVMGLQKEIPNTTVTKIVNKVGETKYVYKSKNNGDMYFKAEDLIFLEKEAE